MREIIACLILSRIARVSLGREITIDTRISEPFNEADDFNGNPAWLWKRVDPVSYFVDTFGVGSEPGDYILDRVKGLKRNGTLVKVDTDEVVELGSEILGKDDVFAARVHYGSLRVRSRKNFCKGDCAYSRKLLHGFTIVELLVVIAIIAILLSMMMPALRQAFASANTTYCANNTKQQGMGVFQYVGDNYGWMPISNDLTSTPGQWKFEILPYLSTNTNPSMLASGVFRCPVWDISGVANLRWRGGYGWSATVSFYDPNVGCGYREGTACPRVRLSSISMPSQTLYSTESTDWKSPSGGDWNYAYAYPPAAISISGIPIPPVGDRHQGGILVNFADGHVAWMHRYELLEGKNGDINWYYKRRK